VTIHLWVVDNDNITFPHQSLDHDEDFNNDSVKFSNQLLGNAR